MDDDDVRPEPDQTEAPMKVEPVEASHDNSSSPDKAKDQKNKFGGHHGFSPKVSARFIHVGLVNCANVFVSTQNTFIITW